MTEFESPDEELVAATPSQRNWKGILIALLVICAVCGLILFSIYLLRPPDDGPRVKGRKITLADITSSRFTFEPFNGSWISDNELLFRDYLGGLSVLNTATLVSRPFVSNFTFRQLNAQIYSVSSDQRFILLVHDDHSVWRHSYLAKYTVYDIANEFSIPLSPQVDSSWDEEQAELQYATWSPVGSGLFFVYRNDIYYKPDPKSPKIVRITDTGEEGLVFNGIPDWVYEEEILRSQSALWPSPDGQRLLYATFNDSQVGESIFSWYGDNMPYPKLWKLRYPKTGTTNPDVSLWLVEDVRRNDSRSLQVRPPASIDAGEYYLTNVQWIRENAITVIWMSRKQTVSIVSQCRAPNWQCDEVHTIRNPGTGWLDYTDPPIFSSNGSSCILRVPLRDGEAGLFRHVVWLDVNSRKEIPITHGPYEVTRIVAWDQANQFIYYIAAPKDKPGERHLYRIPEKSSNSTTMLSSVCLTCPDETVVGAVGADASSSATGKIDPEEASVFAVHSSSSSTSSSPSSSSSSDTSNGSTVPSSSSSISPSSSSSSPLASSSGKEDLLRPCLYNNVIFSPNFDYFVRECLGPDVPTVTLHAAPSGRLLFMLNNNTLLKEEVASMGLPNVRTFKVEVSDGYLAPVRLFLPPGLRDDEEFKFPLVLHVAGSPGSQLVSEKWGLSWEAYLTSQKNYIVAQIDARGTGFQGENIRHSVYRRLGSFEVSDQLNVMHYLRDHLRFIDDENIAIWGEDYGGFLAALIMAEDQSDIFRCGIFVEPITRWEYYSTVYTERYMGMPNFSDNYRGYEQADVTRRETIEKFHNKKFLIIHGTADQKVHLQHTLHFTKELVKNGITFKEQIYPDEGHHLQGVREHFYGTMEAFIEDSFDPMDFDDWEKANFLGIAI